MQPTRSKRLYRSTKRQAQAVETRHQIVEGARKLFIERGYTGATIEAIAQEAGVAPETIYATFGSKRSILARLIDVSVGGDDKPIPLLQRPGPQSVLQEQDPCRQVQLFAQDITVILERVAPVFEIMRLAAMSEPDIAILLHKLLKARLHNMEIFIHHLVEHGPLREGVDERSAAETVWTITSPEVFRLLTGERGWTKQQYIDWLAGTLIRLLLP